MLGLKLVDANVPDLKTEADKGADDDRGVHDVPQVAQVRARVEQYTQVDNLQQHFHGEHAREGVIEPV